MESEPFGDNIIHDHAPVVEEVDGFLAIDPPNGRRIGAGGQANVLNLPRAVDDGDGPEDDAVSLLVQAIGEAKKLDVEIGRVKSMPREFPVANLHLVAVASRTGGHLRVPAHRARRAGSILRWPHRVSVLEPGPRRLYDRPPDSFYAGLRMGEVEVQEVGDPQRQE